MSTRVSSWLITVAAFWSVAVMGYVAAAGRVAPVVAADQETTPYRILVTNDDGVQAPGLLALAQALDSLGDVTVVAPAENQSGRGHSITLSDSIYVDRVALADGRAGWSLVASPVSCVKVALQNLLTEAPDLIVSGINRGYNQGLGAYISGTVGAAREAALRGIPAIAASLDRQGHPDYLAGAAVVRQVAELVKRRGLAPGTFLNVNIPAAGADELRGIRLTTQSDVGGIERFEERRTPGGRRYFWNVYTPPVGGNEGTDLWFNQRGYVSVTPLRPGEFDAEVFEVMRAWRLDAVSVP